MHDIQRARGIVDVVLAAAEREGAERIDSIDLSIGALTFLSPDQLGFWVREMLKGTIGEGAQVVIETLPARLRCAECGFEGEAAIEDDPIYHFTTLTPGCPECGAAQVEIIGGRECVVESLRATRRTD